MESNQERLEQVDWLLGEFAKVEKTAFADQCAIDALRKLREEIVSRIEEETREGGEGQ